MSTISTTSSDPSKWTTVHDLLHNIRDTTLTFAPTKSADPSPFKGKSHPSPSELAHRVVGVEDLNDSILALYRTSINELDSSVLSKPITPAILAEYHKFLQRVKARTLTGNKANWKAIADAYFYYVADLFMNLLDMPGDGTPSHFTWDSGGADKGVIYDFLTAQKTGEVGALYELKTRKVWSGDEIGGKKDVMEHQAFSADGLLLPNRIEPLKPAKGAEAIAIKLGISLQQNGAAIGVVTDFSSFTVFHRVTVTVNGQLRPELRIGRSTLIGDELNLINITILTLLPGVSLAAIGYTEPTPYHPPTPQPPPSPHYHTRARPNPDEDQDDVGEGGGSGSSSKRPNTRSAGTSKLPQAGSSSSNRGSGGRSKSQAGGKGSRSRAGKEKSKDDGASFMNRGGDGGGAESSMFGKRAVEGEGTERDDELPNCIRISFELFDNNFSPDRILHIHPVHQLLTAPSTPASHTRPSPKPERTLQVLEGPFWGSVGFGYRVKGGGQSFFIKVAREGRDDALEDEAAFYQDHLVGFDAAPHYHGFWKGSDWTAILLEDVGESLTDESILEEDEKLSINKIIVELRAKGLLHGDFSRRAVAKDRLGRFRIFDFSHSSLAEKCDEAECI